MIAAQSIEIRQSLLRINRSHVEERMLVVDDRGNPVALVHAQPRTAEPQGRILVADEREDTQAHLLGLRHDVIGHAPVERAVVRLDDAPREIHPQRIGMHLVHLEHVVVQLIRGLVGEDVAVDRLVGEPVRDPVIGGQRVPEITVSHFDAVAGSV